MLIVGPILDGLAGIALPRARKHFFESALAILRKIAGNPLPSILGGYSAIFLAFLFVEPLYNPAIIGPLGTAAGGIAVALLIIGAAIYFVMKVYYARQGLDVSLPSKEMPPEYGIGPNETDSQRHVARSVPGATCIHLLLRFFYKCVQPQA